MFMAVTVEEGHYVTLYACDEDADQECWKSNNGLSHFDGVK